MTPDNFLKLVQDQLDADHNAAALDLVYDHVDDCLLDGRYVDAAGLARAMFDQQWPASFYLSLTTLLRPYSKSSLLAQVARETMLLVKTRWPDLQCS